jgi:hypothetical protein
MMPQYDAFWQQGLSFPRQNLGADIVAATGVMTNFDRMLIGGKEQDVKVISTDQAYQPVQQCRDQFGAVPG